jgi:hypothetical protein
VVISSKQSADVQSSSSLARGRAATRAILWAVPTLLLGATTIVIYGPLQFIPTSVSNRIVDYAVAIAALPLAAMGVVCGVRAAQHLLAVVWPSPLGLVANDDTLKLQLGPFGNVEYPVRELDIRYPFELSGDFDDGGFEQYLPEDEQMARLLPRTSPKARRRSPHNTGFGGRRAQVAAMIRPDRSLRKRHSKGVFTLTHPFP